MTPTCGLPVEKMRVTMQNSQQTGVGACKVNPKHLSVHCNQESILSVFSVQLNKKKLHSHQFLLTIIQLGIYASIYHTTIVNPPVNTTQ